MFRDGGLRHGRWEIVVGQARVQDVIGLFEYEYERDTMGKSSSETIYHKFTTPNESTYLSKCLNSKRPTNSCAHRAV